MKTALSNPFPLGQLVATPGALAALTPEQVAQVVAMHANGDDGDLCADDKEQNLLAHRYHARIFSAYQLGPHTKVWVITEADRSSTRVLLPEEY